MSIGLITAMMFTSLIVGLFLGVPLAFCLGGVAVAFSIWLWGPNSLFIFQSQIYGYIGTVILIAIPLFILMANVLEKSGIADALYDTMYQWMGGLRGGLAMGTVIICTLFAAMAGISAAATITMGVIALPSMLRRNYDKKIAMGCIQAGGALGVLIPPSIIMIMPVGSRRHPRIKKTSCIPIRMTQRFTGSAAMSCSMSSGAPSAL